MSGDSLRISREEQGVLVRFCSPKPPRRHPKHISGSRLPGHPQPVGDGSPFQGGGLLSSEAGRPLSVAPAVSCKKPIPGPTAALLSVNRKQPGADSPRALASRRADSCLRSSSISPGGDDGPAGAQPEPSGPRVPKSDLSVAMGTLGMPPPPVSGGREGKCKGTASDDAPGCWGCLPPNVCCQISSKQNTG